MTNNQRGMGLVQVIWIVAGVLAIVTAAWHMIGNMRDSSVRFNTPTKLSCSPTALRISAISAATADSFPF